jgi:tripartite-type tricarboxylate transporter receptor subunit TctC
MARHLMAAAVLLTGIAGAQAEDYPARTVTIIVPFAAGGPTDITGRIVADIFNHHLDQKFVVENAGSAGGSTHPCISPMAYSGTVP